MSAPENIHQLVKRFEDNRESYRSGKYNETQLRREFLDPFFEALGWDIFNKGGYAETYKDVIHEDSLEIEGENKAPDYAFRIGGVRKFFVEAKKPAVNIEFNIHPAFQLRRYAWSAKLSLGILTDFEEFAIYDCRMKPDKKDKASLGRIALYTYKDYIKKWDEIAAIFSRDAVLKGSFDQYAEGLKGKKGTTEVDDAFLAEIERWRDLLAKNIALRNPSLNVRGLNYAVQITIDRIIFLRICEDRGVERDEQLKEIATQTPTALAGTSPKYDRSSSYLGEAGRGQVYAGLCALFKKADARYNSGLFHFKEEKEQSGSADSLTLSLNVDDKVLQDILKNLYYPESPYVFREIPSDILGQVYERFLGKVIRLTAGHQAKVEEKPEVRKAGGVYYTPTYIVEYIVQNTVGKLLEGDPTPSPSPDPDGKHVRRGGLTPKDVAKLKILDPACGSGTFPLGAYQYLLDWHLKWYLNNEPEKWLTGKNPAIYQASSSPKSDGVGLSSDLGEVSEGRRGLDYRLTTAKKKEILLNNIFGVDIDAQAVEVTKLSLLLKVLEGESSETIGSQLALFQERVLPDLGHNIKCGNSLIGPDYYEGQQLTMGFADEEERYRVNAFDWKGEFSDVFIHGGFDVVIGNPPYGASFTSTEDNYFASHFKTFSGTKDVYTCFIEKATKVLHDRGKLSFIVPSGWTGGPQYTNLRNYLVSSEFEKIVLLPFDIFEDAYVDTLVFVLNNHLPNLEHLVKTYTYPKREKIIQMDIQGYKSVKQGDWVANKDKKFVLDPETIGLLQNLTRMSPRMIKDVCLMRRGVLFDSSLLSDKKISELYFRYFEGDVYRYQINLSVDKWVEFGEKMKERPKEFFWFENQRILLRRLVNRRQRLMASIAGETFITNKNLYSLIPNGVDVNILLGILNSRLLSYLYIRQVTQATKDDFPQVTIKDILSLPFPPEDRIQNIAPRLASLVERMLALHKTPSVLADTSPKSQSAGFGGGGRSPQEQEMVKREIESTDRAIDRLVYELYGLSEEEIRIVEGN
jgi:hypothetical protein